MQQLQTAAQEAVSITGSTYCVIQNTQLSRQVCWVLQLAKDVALTLTVDGHLCVSVGDLQPTAKISVRDEFGVYVGCEIVQSKRTLCALWALQRQF